MPAALKRKKKKRLEHRSRENPEFLGKLEKACFKGNFFIYITVTTEECVPALHLLIVNDCITLLVFGHLIIFGLTAAVETAPCKEQSTAMPFVCAEIWYWDRNVCYAAVSYYCFAVWSSECVHQQQCCYCSYLF